jgi:hypothetical protein
MGTDQRGDEPAVTEETGIAADVATDERAPGGDSAATVKESAATANATVEEPVVVEESAATANATVEEPVVAEEDRWAAFAPRPARAPGRIRRAAAAFGRFSVHEWTLATLGSLVLAVLMTWPALRHPRHTLPHDLGDPTLVTWILAWPGHALTSDPTQLWHANAFHPERWSFAFTDSLLGYAPVSLIGSGVADAVLRYNILYLLAYALAFLGAYALARQLGAGRFGGALVGLAFAYAPWRLAHAGHLHVLSTGGIVLALAMLARGHGWSLRHGFRHRRVRPGWIIAGWLVAAWQVTLGFGIGLPFAYALALISLVIALGWLVRRIARRRRHPVARTLAANMIGGSVFAGVAVLMALPYLVVSDQHEQARRAFHEVEFFSPPPVGFVTAPAESWLWGSRHAGARELLVAPPEMTLLPGFALLGLALAGLVVSVWSWRARAALAGGVLALVALALGSELFDGVVYRPLHQGLPGWDALRTPGRLIIWITLLLALLAAGAITSLAARAREAALARGNPIPGPWLRLLVAVPLLAVLVEGIGATPHEPVPRTPLALANVEGPLLVLPSDERTDMHVMMWTTERFTPVANGASGFVPDSLARTREVTHTFPDPDSVSYLRSIGVETVVVLADRVVGTEWEDALYASGAGLDITREEIGRSVVFHLNP